MAWPLVLLLLFGCLVILMAIGMPVAFSFMLTCMIGAVLFWGGMGGLEQLAISFYSAVTTFIFLPVPLFILMGSIIFESGVGVRMVDAVDKLLGRLPGRLGIVGVVSGALLGSMIGISGGSIALLGMTLLPEMTKRGYKKAISLGPIVASGTLATMIPPTALGVVLGAMGKVPIGKLLIAIIIPGLLLALLFSVYIVIRCVLQPSLAPSYEVLRLGIRQKVNITARHIMPVAVVIFAAIGTVFMGIATPVEASALGALACYILAALYRRLKWQVVKTSAVSTLRITVMVFMIIVGAITFSRILASSGAAAGFIKLAGSLPVSPMLILIATQVVVVILGCFMECSSIVMITAPIFFPLVSALGFDTLWYAVILLLNIQIGLITPPFGLDVYTLKAMAPPDVSVWDVFRSSMPFCAIGYLVIALIMIFPQLALWLPSIMAR